MPTDAEQQPSFDPLEIIRFHDGPKVFGLGPSRLKEKIDAGEIEAPIPLSDSGRALGWTRQMVMNHQARMAALAEERKKAAEPRVKQQQPAALAKVQHGPKKRKLQRKSSAER